MNTYAKEALKIAILQHNAKTAEKILKRGISPNVTDEEGIPYLHLAVRCGYTEIVDLLLSYGVNPNIRDQEQTVALHYTFKDEDKFIKIAESLLKSEANLNVQDKDGWSPLQEAVAQNSMRNSNLFLKYGADPNHVDRFGNTPLNIAISNLNVELVRLLLEYGANAGGWGIGRIESLFSQILNDNPLRKSHLELIKLLIQYGVTPDTSEDVDIAFSLRGYFLNDKNLCNNSSPKDIESSLSELIEKNIYEDDPKLNDEGLLELLELMLKCGFGSNTDLIDLFVCALFFDTNSINFGCEPRCTNILLKHGVTPNMADENGTTAFMYSAQFSFSSEIADLLLEKEPNLLLKDKNDKTTLMYASEGANMEIALKLLQRGVPVNAVDDLGKTALIYLLQSDFYDEDCDESIQFLNALLKNGADPLIKDKEQKTALMYALEHNYKKAEEILNNKIKII